MHNKKIINHLKINLSVVFTSLLLYFIFCSKIISALRLSIPPVDGENLTSLLVVSDGRWKRLTPEEVMLPGSAHVTDKRSTDGCGEDSGRSYEPCVNIKKKKIKRGYT